MKRLSLLLTVFFCLLQFALFANVKKERQWTLVSEREGVEFYISADDSDATGTAKTFVKIRNTNGFQARISFSAVFPCREDRDKRQFESIEVSPSGIAIYTYNVCRLDPTKALILNEIKITEQ